MWKKIWHFLWHEDSLASWLVNLVLAFVLVKWVIYPGIGILLGTSYPIVAVVSSSMEHHPSSFQDWWNLHQGFYTARNITHEQFKTFRFRNGFNKGDIMILIGKEPKSIKTGDVLVYRTSSYQNPIIHRVVSIEQTNDTYRFKTKGDNNFQEDATMVTEENITKTGIAVLRVPLLGWVKIWFVTLLHLGAR